MLCDAILPIDTNFSALARRPRNLGEPIRWLQAPVQVVFCVGAAYHTIVSLNVDWHSMLTTAGLEISVEKAV